MRCTQYRILKEEITPDNIETLNDEYFDKYRVTVIRYYYYDVVFIIIPILYYM